MNTRRTLRTLAGATAAVQLLLAGTSNGQSLFQRPIQTNPANPSPGEPAADPGKPGEGGDSANPAASPVPSVPTAGAAPSIAEASMMAVVPPKPRTWQKNDKVELIINQTSLQSAEQTLETKKQYDLKAQLKQFPSLRKLIEDATIANGIAATGPSAEASGTDNYKGSGKGERKDRFTARISAIVVEVKPNGYLLLEARESEQFDNDIKTLVVAGLCDPKDITVQGTVQSTSVANLSIRVENSGDVKDGSTKGWIPRILDTIFGL